MNKPIPSRAFEIVATAGLSLLSVVLTILASSNSVAGGDPGKPEAAVPTYMLWVAPMVFAAAVGSACGLHFWRFIFWATLISALTLLFSLGAETELKLAIVAAGCFLSWVVNRLTTPLVRRLG